MTEAPKKTPRLLSIDALRGAAALAVFFFHASQLARFDKRTLPPFRVFGRSFAGLLSPLSLGASGVSLFFVVSGFCLALQQWRDGSKPTMSLAQVRQYAWGRVARIGPAYWVTVLICMAVGAALLPATAIEFRKGIAYHGLMHLGFLHAFDPDTWLSLNGALWSMATEVQFYVVFPLLLVAYARLGGPIFFGLSIAANLIFRVLILLPVFGLSSTWSTLLGYQLPGRIAEFALGMALCELYLRADRQVWAKRCVWLLVPALPLALYVRAFGPAFAPELLLGFVYFLTCGFIILDGRVDRAKSPLSQRSVSLAAKFGRASYSFFLIHAPVLQILDSICPLSVDDRWGRFWYFAALGLPLGALAASMLYMGIEIPLWRLLTRKPAIAATS